ncbi:MAG TPA: cytochrome P450 [Acidimicrobiia bacterium]|nr:cytochrome P450 [Acidimicrobiia bacterium]
MTDTTDTTGTGADAESPVEALYMNMGMQVMFDLAAPQPNYKELIEAGGYVEAMPGMGLSFKRENTEFVLRHNEFFSNHAESFSAGLRPLVPLNVDPPRHGKYRKLLDPLFAPKRMDEQEADITRRVNGYIDTFIDRGECNFSEEFAELFPSSVFLGLMGLPEEELRMFLRMRDGILHPEKWDPEALSDPEKRIAVSQAAGAEIYEYFGNLVDERANHPANDIVTKFLAAEIDGDKLTKDEILDLFFLFLIAGLDTVSDTLTCSYAFLATHPEHRMQIVENPAIIPSAVEELLRWESPVPSGMPRTCVADVELPSGVKVTKGTAVLPSFGAANVDPSAYDDPFEVRFDRESNPHIAFGGGVHRCLGSHLARRELRVTLREWHRRIPEYRIKPGHETLEYPPGLRHVKDLTLSW